MQPNYYTIDELSERWGISDIKVIQLIVSNELKVSQMRTDGSFLTRSKFTDYIDYNWEHDDRMESPDFDIIEAVKGEKRRLFVTAEEVLRYEETQQNPDSSKQPRPSDETKEKISLLKLVAVMAVAGYSKRPPELATREITADAERIGIKIAEGTIRKWLREAAEHVPRNEEDC